MHMKCLNCCIYIIACLICIDMLHPKGDAVGVTDVIQKIQAAQSSFASMDPTVGCQGGFF